MAVASGDHHRDRGFTLVELVVAMFLLGILGIMVTTSIRVVARTSTGVTERVDAQSQARVALGALTKDVRLATTPPNSTSTPIRVAEANQIEFTSNVDQLDIPVLLQIERTTAGLQETQTDGSVVVDADGEETVEYPSTPTQRYLARDVVDGGLPLFTYFDRLGNDLADGTGTVPAAKRGQIALVRISVTVKPNPNSAARATTLTSTVRLVNELSRD